MAEYLTGSAESLTGSDVDRSRLLEVLGEVRALAEGSDPMGENLISSIQTADIFSARGEISHITDNTSMFVNLAGERSLPIATLASAPETILTNVTDVPPAPKPRAKSRTAQPAIEPPAASLSSNSTTVNTSISGTTATDMGPPVAKTRSKPRPRPIFKGKTAAAAEQTPGQDFSNLAGVADSVSAVSSGVNTGNVTPIDDISAFSSVSERTKLRSRARAAQSKAPDRLTGDVIVISSDDEISFWPSKSRSKPRTAKKSPAKQTRTSDVVEPTMPDLTPGSLPAPTSDFSIHNGSPLPPSDPPLPSTATAPPISPVRPDGRIRSESPLSSPLSSPTRKRKRVASSDNEEVGTRPAKKSSPSKKRDMPPPPPPPRFFASSSSGPGSAAAAATPQEIEIEPSLPPVEAPTAKKRNTRKRKNADEEEDFNPDKEPPKPKGRGRKKKVDEDDEDFGAKPKRTKKSPLKPKRSSDRVEVVVSMPKPRSRGRTNSGGVVPETQVDDLLLGPAHPGSSFPPGLIPPPEVFQNPPESPLVPGLGLDDPPLDNGNPVPSKAKRGRTKGKGRAIEVSSELTEPSDEAGVSVSSSSKSKSKRRVVDSPGVEVEAEQPPAQTKRGRGSSSRKESTPSEGNRSQSSASGGSGLGRVGSFKENAELEVQEPPTSPHPARTPSSSSKPGFSRAHSIANSKMTPMSELIRKVNSLPGSPFATGRTSYSPYIKSSRNVLRRIAPLHPTRRTPPPPPPRLPPPKKSKKELQREEKWEMELEDTVEGWYALPEEERAALRKAKRNAEMGFDD